MKNLQLAKKIPDIQLLADAAYAAGKIIRQEYGRLHEIERKGEGVGVLVSHVDRDCDRTFQDVIHTVYPDIPILSEELNPGTSHSGQKLLILDPLDGTSAYIYGVSRSMPSVMAAILENGKMSLSLVYFPLTDEIFYAAKGYGAFKGQTRLHCVSTELEDSWVEMNQYSDYQFETEIFSKLRNNLRKAGGAQLLTTLPPHSGLGLRIAERGTGGEQDISAIIHDNGPKELKQGPWDVFPIALIVEEAGGVVVNFRGEPYDPFKPEPFIVASSMRLAEEIIKRAA